MSVSYTHLDVYKRQNTLRMKGLSQRRLSNRSRSARTGRETALRSMGQSFRSNQCGKIADRARADRIACIDFPRLSMIP